MKRFFSGCWDWLPKQYWSMFLDTTRTEEITHDILVRFFIDDKCKC